MHRITLSRSLYDTNLDLKGGKIMFCQILVIIYAFNFNPPPFPPPPPPEHVCNSVNRKYFATENTSLKKEQKFTDWPKSGTRTCLTCNNKWATPWENVSYVICEQQRRRSACASAQSDQRLCCSLLRWYDISRFYSRNFKSLASCCSWGGPVWVWPGRKLPKIRFLMTRLKSIVPCKD